MKVNINRDKGQKKTFKKYENFAQLVCSSLQMPLCMYIPLIDALCSYGVDSVYVGYRENGLISRGICRELH